MGCRKLFDHDRALGVGGFPCGRIVEVFAAMNVRAAKGSSTPSGLPGTLPSGAAGWSTGPLSSVGGAAVCAGEPGVGVLSPLRANGASRLSYGQCGADYTWSDPNALPVRSDEI